MNKYQDLLAHMGEAPEDQIAHTQAIKFTEMSKRDEQPKAAELKEILDQCAYASLASDFSMVAMDYIWKMLLVDEASA